MIFMNTGSIEHLFVKKLANLKTTFKRQTSQTSVLEQADHESSQSLNQLRRFSFWITAHIAALWDSMLRVAAYQGVCVMLLISARVGYLVWLHIHSFIRHGPILGTLFALWPWVLEMRKKRAFSGQQHWSASCSIPIVYSERNFSSSC